MMKRGFFVVGDVVGVVVALVVALVVVYGTVFLYCFIRSPSVEPGSGISKRLKV